MLTRAGAIPALVLGALLLHADPLAGRTSGLSVGGPASYVQQPQTPQVTPTVTYTKQLFSWGQFLTNAGLLALLGSLLAVWLQHRMKHVHQLQLETARGENEMRRQVAQQRATAYRTLWELTQAMGAERGKPHTRRERERLADELTQWYYSEGNGLYLGLHATALFFWLSDRLRDTGTDEELAVSVDDLLSAMRTRLKYDVGVYADEDLGRAVRRIDRTEVFPSEWRTDSGHRDSAR